VVVVVVVVAREQARKTGCASHCKFAAIQRWR